MTRLLTFLACTLCLTASGQSKPKTENVILITLNGMRWQEIFGGAEARLIAKDFVSDSAALKRDFWAVALPMMRGSLPMTNSITPIKQSWNLSIVSLPLRER